LARTVFFVSDGTGITAETLGQSLLTQFNMLVFEYITISYVDNLEKAQQTLERIKEVYMQCGERPLVFATLINSEISQFLQQSPALFMDFFQIFKHSFIHWKLN
jgi:regulator of PEP synthase PpsR (kinase-PPPase family)